MTVESIVAPTQIVIVRGCVICEAAEDHYAEVGTPYVVRQPVRGELKFGEWCGREHNDAELP